MPAPKDTYVNGLLTNISVAYQNSNLIADQVFPTVVVDKKTGLYFVADKGNLRAPTDVNRTGLSRANRVSNTLTTQAYALTEKSLETDIIDDVLQNAADPFQPKANAARLVKGQLLVNREIDLLNTLVAASTPTDLSGSWSTTSTDIIGQIRSGRNTILTNTGQDANTLILGKEAYDLALENAAVVDRLKYTSRASEASIASALADFFGVDNVLIGKGVKNTGKENQSDNLSFIWGEYIVLMYVAPSPAIDVASAGYHLSLQGGEYVDEWYEQAIKTTFVRANMYDSQEIVDASAIKIWSNAKA